MCIDYTDCTFELPQDAIDTLYSLTKFFVQLSEQNRELFTTTLIEKTAYLMDFIFQKVQKGEEAVSQTQFDQEFKNGVKIIFYFFCCATAHIETVCGSSSSALDAPTKKAGAAKGTKKAAKKTEDEDFSWASIRIIFLQTLKRMLTVPPSLLWSMGIIQENFLSGIWGYAVKLLDERPAGILGTGAAEGAARAICKDIVVRCVGYFGNANVSGSYTLLTAALLEGINRSEHMSTFTAEICGKSPALLTAEFLKEISAMEFTSQSANTAGMKNVGTFVEDLVKYNSQIMIANLPVILRQLDAGAHQIRSSLLTALGQMVLKVDTQIKSQGVVSEPIPVPTTLQGAERSTEEAADQLDLEGPESQTTMLPRIRDTILDMIVERTHDVSPYTRATVLKVWHTLLTAEAVPVRRFASIAELALDRLYDKAAAVRKASIALLTTVMDHNPYGSSLDHLMFAQQKTLMESKLADRLEQMKVAFLAARAQVSVKRSEAAGAAVSTEHRADNGEEEDDDDDDGEFDMDAFALTPDVVDDAEVQSMRKGIEYCSSALEMISSIVQAGPKVEAMLKSKSSLEVAEALKFIARTVSFSVRGSMKSFTGALPLVFHTEASIRDACINSFKSVFLMTGDSESADSALLPPAEVAKSLCHLLRTFGPNERASIEEIIKELFSKNQLDSQIAAELWRIVVDAENIPVDAFQAAHKKSSDLGVALCILSIIARNGDITNATEAKLRLAVHHGLSKSVFASLDFSAMKATAMFMQECAPFLVSDLNSAPESEKTDSKRRLFEEASKKLVSVILGGMCEEDEEFTRAWFPACEEAVQALYHIHPSADVVLGSVVKSMYASFALAGESGMSSSKIMCSAARLSRFLFVLGQAALNTVVFADQLQNKAKKVVLQHAREELSKQRSVDDANANEDDAEMTAQVDAEHDNCYYHTTEKGLVLQNLLGKFHPIIALVVANQTSQFSHPLLRETSVLSLCKYMCVSSVICDKYLPLLFTALERESVESCRTTILLAFGDLMMRFPNSLEAWTALMYARLGDDKVIVRYNALMVLTHLILNDMVKVKGQVAHVVMCLSDTEVKIRDLAHIFFVKLSERSNNPVYNLLGDIIGIISREKEASSSSGSGGSASEAVVQVASLSAESLNYPQRELTAKEFQSTMHFLLSFVKKDKQADSMLERLLVRLGTAQSLRQRRSLAFCISELTVTEKGIKKMAEMIRTIKDALYDEEVFDYVLKAVKNTKKEGVRGASAEDKKVTDDLEKALLAIARDARGEEAELRMEEEASASSAADELNADGSENTIPNTNAAPTATEEFSLRGSSKASSKGASAKGKAAANKTPSKTPTKKAKPKTKKKVVDSDEDDGMDEEEAEADFEQATPVKTTKSTSRSRRVLADVN